MDSKDVRGRRPRRRSIELLEHRQVLSADPIGQFLGGMISQPGLADPLEHHALADAPALVHHSDRDADFWLDSSAERDMEWMLGEIEQTLASAHNASGLTQVRNDYGFIGTGQTVAVIDSGIAWNHVALGGGFGANYRVVGGWDFTEENDANPYDDGPAGSHGTHVAGIVGADRTGTSDDGVAPGVDLVGLRVFNDQGDGYFSWVEQALQWVHQNRNAFENPITAVNLSIGTTWNSNSVPAWSSLEDEFSQLYADGIFVSVSAGNDFTTYNTAGLSYPAASPWVVPVMSADDGGNLSFFSQRHTRAIAAPGRFIVSTIPDYTGNNNGIADDYASYSGTSMAAPYVAGASVLLREAMEFVGYVNITQDTIFDHMMDTADSFFDSATSQWYQRLNLASAFADLMPTDDYGSTIATAHNLGTLASGTSSISGLVNTLSDADYFRFTAGQTGTVTFTADTTHSLAPAWAGSGTVSGAHGETFVIQVVAGQSYTVGLSTSGGIGYYDLGIELDAGPAAPGSFQVTVASATQVGLSWSAATGATFYQVVHWSSQAGTNVVATLGSGATNYTVTGLAPGTRHWFQVVAGNSSGVAQTEFKLGETPPIPVTAPATFQVTVVSPTQVGLSWSAATGATFYQVVHWNEQAGTNVVATLGAGATNYTVTGLAPGTRHWFRIVAGNSSGVAQTEFKIGETPATAGLLSANLNASIPHAQSMDFSFYAGSFSPAARGGSFVRALHGTASPGKMPWAIGADIDSGATTGLADDPHRLFFNSRSADDVVPSSVPGERVLPSGIHVDLERKLRALDELIGQDLFDEVPGGSTNDELLGVLAESSLTANWDDRPNRDAIAQLWQSE